MTTEYRLEWGIRRRMADCGIRSYGDLAKRAGVQARTAQLAHRSGTQVGTLDKIAGALSCDVEDLFIPNEEKTS